MGGWVGGWEDLLDRQLRTQAPHVMGGLEAFSRVFPKHLQHRVFLDAHAHVPQHDANEPLELPTA